MFIASHSKKGKVEQGIRVSYKGMYIKLYIPVHVHVEGINPKHEK